MNKRELTRKEFKTLGVDGEISIFDSHSVKLELLKYGNHNDRTEKDTYVIGDLNGSAIKLLQFLVSTGVLKGTLANRAAYKKFEQWYTTHSDTWLSIDYEIYESRGASGVDRWIKYKEDISKQLKDVVTLLSGLSLDRERCNAVRLVFVGDTLADRGVSDTATLKIYDLLQKSGIDYTVVLSNHDFTVVAKYVTDSWRTPIHEDLKNNPANIPQTGSFDCNSLYEQTKKMFVESYLPKLDLVYLESLRNENEVVQCAVSHAPIISQYLFGLEKTLREDYYTSLPTEARYQISVIDVTDQTLPLLDRLRAACFNLQMMFRSLRDAYISKDNQTLFVDFLRSYFKKEGHLQPFVENRDEPIKIHDDFLNIYGHSAHAGTEYLIRDETGETVKKGIRFAPKREDRSGMNINSRQSIMAMDDVPQTKNNANNICLDNSSGRAGKEEIPLLTARISTTDAKFTPKNKAFFELEMARNSILEGIENYIRETDRLRGVTATNQGKWRVQGHGKDGRRRAIALKVLVDSAANFYDLYEALHDLVSGRIRDANGAIGGAIRLNPGSLTTTIINAISKVPCFVIDFRITNNRDHNSLTGIKTMMGLPRQVNHKRSAIRLR